MSLGVNSTRGNRIVIDCRVPPMCQYNPEWTIYWLNVWRHIQDQHSNFGLIPRWGSTFSKDVLAKFSQISDLFAIIAWIRHVFNRENMQTLKFSMNLVKRTEKKTKMMRIFLIMLPFLPKSMRASHKGDYI